MNRPSHSNRRSLQNKQKAPHRPLRRDHRCRRERRRAASSYFAKTQHEDIVRAMMRSPFPTAHLIRTCSSSKPRYHADDTAKPSHPYTHAAVHFLPFSFMPLHSSPTSRTVYSAAECHCIIMYEHTCVEERSVHVCFPFALFRYVQIKTRTKNPAVRICAKKEHDHTRYTFTFPSQPQLARTPS